MLFRKKKNNPAYNIHHPDLRDKVEKAFRAGGVDYYRFKETLDMPAGRYKWYFGFLREVDMRMDQEMLFRYIDALELELNGGPNGKQVRVTELMKIVINMRTRVKLGWEPMSVRRLSSVAYFDETESLSGYSQEYGQKKIKLWEKHGVVDFFLTRPISDLLGLSNTSKESLEEYISRSLQIIEDLNSELPSPSSESSSKDGKKT